MAKTYLCERRRGGCNVTVDTGDEKVYKLPPRLEIRNHSPTGFEWGYGGSGPAQLALAMLADCRNDEMAIAYYQKFKWDVIARVKSDVWSIEEEEIHGWFEKKAHD